jgi:hypothetical protein
MTAQFPPATGDANATMVAVDYGPIAPEDWDFSPLIINHGLGTLTPTVTVWRTGETTVLHTPGIAERISEDTELEMTISAVDENTTSVQFTAASPYTYRVIVGATPAPETP